jgi:hypothetical protein
VAGTKLQCLCLLLLAIWTFAIETNRPTQAFGFDFSVRKLVLGKPAIYTPTTRIFAFEAFIQKGPKENRKLPLSQKLSSTC